MDTKACRHCRQPIAIDARRCQHCHGFQSWWANFRDPRYQVIWPVLMLAIFGAFYFFMRSTFEPGDDHGAPPRLSVSEIESRVVPTTDGQRIFVIGRVQNASSQDAASIWFRVNLFDAANHLTDTFLVDSRGLVVPGNGTTMFRVFGPTSAPATEIRRTEVLVERAKVRSKWD